MVDVPLARHLLRAKDLAAAAGLSPAHFSREFRRMFGSSPLAYR